MARSEILMLKDGDKQCTDVFDKLLQATDRNCKTPDHDPMEFLRVETLNKLYEGQHHL
jgi:hypothetical protein